MTTIGGIDGSTGWSPTIDSDEDEVRRRAAAASTAKVATAPPEVPQGPDTNGALLMRAAQAQGGTQAAAPKPLLALGIEAAAATPDQDTLVQNRMNAFFKSAVPTYRVPAAGGGTVAVTVATPFQMASKTPERPGETDETTLRFIAHEKSVTTKASELQAIAAKVGIGPGTVGAITVGRGSPDQVHEVTQALIDRNKLPPAIGDEAHGARVRRMMYDYGIGFDCAGFTQQALLAAHGITRAQAGLQPDLMNESLSNLAPPRFKTVAPQDARAGDVIALGPLDPKSTEVGHRVIVFDRHDATPEELKSYSQWRRGAAFTAGHVSVLVVDSSFGASGLAEKGGVLRQTWLYDSVRQQWGTVIPASRDGNHVYPEHVNVQDQPYDLHHRLLGVYHYNGAH